MRSAVAAIAGLTAVLGPAALADQTIDVGGTEITVPDPPGFTLVTPEMTPLYEALESLTPSTHRRYAAYIPDELAPGALAGEAQDYLRLLTVQDIVGVGDRTLTPEQFATVKESIRSQNAEMLRGIAEGEGGQAGDPHIPSALMVTDYVPLPMHAESDRSAAFIAFMYTSATPGGALSGARRMAASMTLLHTRSKALLLNVGAIDSDLEWAQSFSEDWTGAILAANAEGAE